MKKYRKTLSSFSNHAIQKIGVRGQGASYSQIAADFDLARKKKPKKGRRPDTWVYRGEWLDYVVNSQGIVFTVLDIRWRKGGVKRWTRKK